MKIGAQLTSSPPGRLPSAKPGAKAAIGAGTRKRKNAAPEYALHCQVADYLSRAIRSPQWWTTIPAGNSTAKHGARNKRLGYAPGTPDVLVIDAGRAIWLELKAPGKQLDLSDAQVDTHVDLLEAGSAVWICASVESVENALRDSGVPLHASVRAKVAA